MRSRTASLAAAAYSAYNIGAERLARALSWARAHGMIDRPTLVIGSAESSLAEAQKKMAAAIPGAELLLLKGTGHAVFVDEPEIFAQALKRLTSK
jgi:pimeloyl-ACP methyl ester carboxylesterase